MSVIENLTQFPYLRSITINFTYYPAYGSPMPMRRNLVQCSVVSTYDTANAYTKNEDFNSGGTGGFTANTGTVSNPTGNQLHMTANWASKPLATTSVYLVNGRSYTLNLDIVGFSVVSGFSHTVRVRVVLPGAAFNTDFTTTGTKTITFTSNTTGYVNIEIRSIISPPTGVYSGNPYIDIDNFKVSWDSAFTSSDTICVSKSGYRYGFNGMEKVDEVSGEGNGYDFGARMYDGRLGRWFSVDPFFRKYESHSTYNFGLNSPLSYGDYQGCWIVGSDGQPVTYTRNEDGTITWSSNATAEIITIGNAMLATPIGEKSFNKWMNASTKVNLFIDYKHKPRNYTALTIPNNNLGLNSDGQYVEIDVVFYPKSIKREINKKFGKSRWSGASFDEAFGAIGTHETNHNDKDQIQLDMEVTPESAQDPNKNLPVNMEIEFRRQYNYMKNNFYNFWELQYMKRGYNGIKDGTPRSIYFDPPLDAKPKSLNTPKIDNNYTTQETYLV